MKVGFIGAGRMGWPMINRLTAAGHEVRVLTRTVGAARHAAASAVPSASSIGAVCAGVEAVIVCVFSDQQVQEVCLGATGVVSAMSPGAVLIVHTTGSPDTARLLASAASANQVGVVDAPVSGSPDDIAAGHLTMFVGGGDAFFEQIRPLLACYGSTILHVGEAGTGQAVKLVNNALFAANLGLIADAMRLGRSLGAEESALLRALVHGSGSSRAATMIAAMGSVDDFTSVTAEFVSKDITVVRQIAETTGADLGLVGVVLSSQVGRDNVLGANPVARAASGSVPLGLLEAHDRGNEDGS